ncbi:MAG: chemotaxis protein CheA [Pseudorhodobacter sp. PARRP1]|nr:MAG: chemotaxis protein CheA [Pseudorhodobacter sp. PARRP1]
MTSSIDLRQTLFQECEELLEALDDGLTLLWNGSDADDVDQETVNAVFRAVHSIKGGAAAFGLEALVRFAHHFENALDAVRSGRLIPTPDIIGVFLRSADYLADLVASARNDAPSHSTHGPDLVTRLNEMLPSSQADLTLKPAPATLPNTVDESAEIARFQPIAFSFEFDTTPEPETVFQIHFACTRRLYAVGHDPVHIFRSLADLGTLQTQVDSSSLPTFAEMDWSEAYFAWNLALYTKESVAAIHTVFEFLEGICTYEISVLPSDQKSEVDVLEAQAARALSAPEPDVVPVVVPNDLKAAQGYSKPEKSASSSAPSQRGSVRVDLELVDRLINIVGELVINQSVLAQCMQDSGISGQSDVGTSLDEFRSLARELQENVMAIRAQPVKPLFQRMARIIREASDIAGKTVDFEAEGEAVEVDKTVIEQLVDPLTHIIRNAVDHGLEQRSARLAAGKPEIGVVRLSAAHRSGRVLIEVSDDGAGINRPKVRQIAIDKGLVPADAVLEDSEIDKLLFLPGFSTAAKVTDLSGRGVGMDVVRSAIQSLGGRVNITSTPGKGTTISISLPLTLAVLDGMVVDVAGQTMVVPITAIVETLRPSAADLHHFAAAGKVVAVRETFVPIIDLAEAFGHRAAMEDYSNMVLLLVETGQNERWALAVDKIYDQRQVVIKGLESNYGHVPGVAAATILGDGKIALIIDPDETAQRKRRAFGVVTNPISEEA